MALETQEIGYRDGGTSLKGFLAWDNKTAVRRPGVLVVHGGAGLDDHARARATGIAKLGFAAFACDMYGEGVAGNRERVMGLLMRYRDDRQALRSRALSGLHQISTHPLVDGRLAAIGFCFGGMTVLELARAGTELAGVVSMHGSLDSPLPAEAGEIRTKILVCHGALDPHVPMGQVTGFLDEMNRANADYQFIVYSGALHGFTHEHAAMNPVPGVAYHPTVDRRSWTAMKDFFSEVFG
jgi:dienelactone hydrolase